MELCKGNGDCILSKQLDSNPIICNHRCIPKKCLNSILCGSSQSNTIILNNICFSCDVTFGKPIKFSENIECHECSFQGKGGMLPNSTHTLCLKCFHKKYYTDPIPGPVYPYSEDSSDPILIKYYKDYNEWTDKLLDNYKKQEALKICKKCTANC